MGEDAADADAISRVRSIQRQIRHQLYIRLLIGVKNKRDSQRCRDVVVSLFQEGLVRSRTQCTFTSEAALIVKRAQGERRNVEDLSRGSGLPPPNPRH